MYVNVMKYMDRLFNAVRPRRLLYMAIDGVAPRAKMNQQRSRRFKAAKEAGELKDLQDEIRQEMARYVNPLLCIMNFNTYLLRTF